MVEAAPTRSQGNFFVLQIFFYCRGFLPRIFCQANSRGPEIKNLNLGRGYRNRHMAVRVRTTEVYETRPRRRRAPPRVLQPCSTASRLQASASPWAGGMCTCTRSKKTKTTPKRRCPSARALGTHLGGGVLPPTDNSTAHAPHRPCVLRTEPPGDSHSAGVAQRSAERGSKHDPSAATGSSQDRHYQEQGN